MAKVLELLVKYLGLPLLQKLGEWVLSLYKDYQKKRDIIKDQKKKEKAIEDAKSPEEIRTAHRNNKL